MRSSRSITRFWPYFLIAAVYAFATSATIIDVFRRYDEFRLGWSWDLAYYNQWFWSTSHGIGTISVRPVASFGEEGPSIWKMNYLAPIRVLILPFYSLYPHPKTLLLIHAILFWLLIPAAYTLARSEGVGRAVAVAAALSSTFVPLLHPLAVNDFRELQIAIPFVLWAIEGYRSRRLGLSAWGIGGLLCCRQEYAIVVGSLAFVPPREREDPGKTLVWRQSVVLIGVVWFCWIYLGYLRWMIGPNAPDHFLEEFMKPKPPWDEIARTATGIVVIGLGGWALLGCAAPRLTLICLPWLWGLATGRWAIRLIETEDWHGVRYAAPFAASSLAAGLVGYARIANRLMSLRRGAVFVPIFAILVALSLAIPHVEIARKLDRVPRRIDADEAAIVWKWIDRIAPDEGVMAVYDVSAQLSSRRLLSSYILDQNKPIGFPKLKPVYQWVFTRANDIPESIWINQGFELVHHGRAVRIYRRAASDARSAAKKSASSERLSQ